MQRLKCVSSPHCISRKAETKNMFHCCFQLCNQALKVVTTPPLLKELKVAQHRKPNSMTERSDNHRGCQHETFQKSMYIHVASFHSGYMTGHGGPTFFLNSETIKHCPLRYSVPLCMGVEVARHHLPHSNL